MAVTSRPGGSRPAERAAAAYDCGVRRLTFDHSISAARSRIVVRSNWRRSLLAASATAVAFCASTSGAAPPTACGQK